MWSDRPAERALRSSALLACLACAALLPGCGGEAPAPFHPEEASAALGNGQDLQFWRDSRFPGSTNEGGWYDSDVPWSRGSYVRLPVDSQYVGNWYATTSCVGGGTAVMNSPLFQATVNGVTRRFVFNHLIQNQFFIPTTADQQWYNGGALIGLTGGDQCNEGYPTHSSGPHFCNQLQSEDPYTFWNGSSTYSSNTVLPDYQSRCTGLNGSSGVGNPVCAVCSGHRCAPGQFCWGTKCCTACNIGCPC